MCFLCHSDLKIFYYGVFWLIRQTLQIWYFCWNLASHSPQVIFNKQLAFYSFPIALHITLELQGWQHPWKQSKGNETLGYINKYL